ncbi:MAG: biotin transporter BioY [Rickettsiaceae bacterium]|nr:biotin transporter BioY [Rickettsiaceae bacterium]
MQSSQTKSKSILDITIIRILLGTFFIFLSSQVYIPLEPVPINMLTAGVMILALTYKKGESLSSVLLFIILGAIGVPVFAGFSGGMSILTGSTAGYIFGCVVCTYFVANMREKYGEDSWLKLAIYGTLGTIVIFIFGLSYLAYFLVSIKGAIIYGLIPFIGPGIAKILFTASTVRLLKNLNARRR